MRGGSGVSSGSVCCRGRFGLGQRVNHRVKGESSASTRCCLMFEYVCFLGRDGGCWIDCGQFFTCQSFHISLWDLSMNGDLLRTQPPCLCFLRRNLGLK